MMALERNLQIKINSGWLHDGRVNVA